MKTKEQIQTRINKLEKTFFDTFGIEKRCKFDKYCDDCNTCGCYHYPRITDNILLELIFILTTLLDTTIYEDVFITIAKNREELKKDIFKECILYKQHIKQQVRALFDEE